MVAVPGDARYQQFTQELRLSGDILENVSYVTGVYYYQTTMNHNQGTNQYLQLPFGLDPGVSCSTIGPPIAPFAGFYVDNPSLGNLLCQTSIPLPSWQQTQENVKSQAVFGAFNWDVTDRVELSIGLRWLKDTKDFKGAFYTADAPSAIDPPMRANTATPDPGFPVNQNEDWDRTIGKFSAMWRPTAMNTPYASYSQGFRSGGFSNRGNDPRFLAYKPKNLADTEYLDEALPLGNGGFQGWGSPRTYALEVTWQM